MLLRKLSPALLLLGLSLSVVTGCQNQGSGPAANTPAATRTVGAVDMEALVGLDEFKKAQKDIDKLSEDFRKEAEAKLPKNPRDWQKKDQVWLTEKRTEVQKKQNAIMEPLQQRKEAAILKISRDHKLTVMLDKRIVVYGVADYTDEVKKTFQGKDEIKVGDEVDTSKSPIGYFDQDVVRSLKVFQLVETQVQRKQMELMKKLQEAKDKVSPAELEVLQNNASGELEAYKEQLVTELFSKVNDSVKEVAESQGLALVLDKTHVLQGGRNMTSEVVDTFLKKTADKGGDKPRKAPSGTPTP
ncbi:MAG: OmpH family outer membrane protein [Candidatus Eremiobacteraeota bacterium]|nr:OmpH family outer membrane protein [Candidatus Eremiobacteraeota bacterium]MCW5868506.1 OmpH family outer membrane protein [Candidatus Eremiobacteraeota bacterium]